MSQQKNEKLEEQRLDSWLWASRFFKTRKIAQNAITSGNVWINGNKTKPAKTVKAGDTLVIRRNYEKFEIEVLALCAKRVSASIAQTLYHEPEHSKQKRLEQRELQKQNALSAPYTPNRPSKRDRRKLLKLKTKLN